MTKQLRNRTFRQKDRLVFESMVRQRDEEIAALRTELRADREALARTRDELEEVRRIYEADMRLHAKRAETMRQENVGMREEIAILRRDINAEALIATYADIMKAKGSCPGSASRLQTALCKAMHMVEVLTDQVESVKKSCDKRVASLVEGMGELIFEKGQREANMMKEVRALKEARRIANEEYSEDLKKKQGAIERLEEKLDEVMTRAQGQISYESDSSTEDSSLALNALKQQLNAISSEKEAVENDLTQKLKSRDETIALLQEVNAANGKHMELLRQDIEKCKDEVEADSTSESVGSCSSCSDGQECAEALLTLMGDLATITGSMENGVMASIRRKRKLINSLDDDQTTVPELVAWSSAGDFGAPLSRQPSMLSLKSSWAA